MQARNQNISDFSSRVEALAERGRISMREVGPKILGISTAQLFAYRSGSAPLSVKAWAKLEAAESANGARSEAGQIESAAVSEPRAPYGDESDLTEEINRHHAGLLLAAKGDPVRLGWIREQQQAHLAIPAHWQASPGKITRVVVPSQTVPLSSATGLPLPQSSRRARTG